MRSASSGFFLVWVVSDSALLDQSPREADGQEGACPSTASGEESRLPPKYNRIFRVDPVTRESVALPCVSRHEPLKTNYPGEEDERDSRDERSVYRKCWAAKAELVCLVNGGQLISALVNHPKVCIPAKSCPQDHLVITKHGVALTSVHNSKLMFVTREFLDRSEWRRVNAAERLLLPHECRRKRALFPFGHACYKRDVLRPFLYSKPSL